MPELLSARIKQVRTTFHLNQRDFCQRIELPQSRLSEIETGKTKPSYSTLQNIATAFSISLDWLILGRGQMTYTQPLTQQDPISPDEMQLLSAYRSLSDSNKMRIQGMIELKLSEQDEPRQKSSPSQQTTSPDLLA